MQPHVLERTATRDDMLCVLRPRLSATATATARRTVLMSFERELTEEEILAGWRRKGELASHLGTEAHWLAECLFNGVPTRWWEPEVAIVMDFCRRYLVPRGIVGFNTEKEIVCIDGGVPGSIDLILYEPATGLHHILDFKRSDNSRRSSRSRR